MKSMNDDKTMAVAAVCAAVAITIALAACQVHGDGAASVENENRQTAQTSDAAPTDSGGASRVSVPEDGEWPGQSLGYVGPNGEGVLDPEDFETSEEYRAAAAEAAAKEVEVPFEVVGEGEGPESVKGKIWLTFAEGCSELDARSIVSDNGGVWVSSTFKWGSRSAETYFEDCGDLESIQQACQRLMENDEVESAYPELIETSGDLHVTVDDTLASGQVYLSSAGFYDAWDEAQCNLCASIAFLDTGVCRLHEDLSENVLGGYDAYNSTVLNLSDCEDTSGHGTLVAGVACAVAGNHKGLAGCSYNATLKAIRVTVEDETISVATVKRALEYLHNIDTPDVINMSFGLAALEDENPIAWLIRSDMQGLIDDLHDDGVVMVASVGNDGDDNEHYPAKFDHVIGVGSVESDRSHSSFSNACGTVDICAFGSGVRTTLNPNYNNGSLYVNDGAETSLAAPQVAAAAALLKAQDPNRDADDVEELLFDNAIHPNGFVDVVGGGPSNNDPDGKDDLGRYGHGVLDAAAAVGWTPSGGSGSGTSPFTGPADGIELDARQVVYQRGLQSTVAERVPEALEGAMAANPDVAAWLYVPGTSVSVPVAVSGGDFYLDHDPLGNPSPIGCAFASSPGGAFGGAVTVVYGHSFDFGSLAFT